MPFRLLALTLFVTLAACSKKSSDSGSSSVDEDSSVSGAAASVVGGTVQNSTSSGTIAMYRPQVSPLWLRPIIGAEAIASGNTCPTLKSTAGTGANSCSSTSNVATLAYSSCTFGGSGTWNGYMNVSFSGATTLSCGTFPSPTADTMLRQFVSAAGVAATGTRTSPAGAVVTIDDTLSGVQSNYQSDLFNGSGASGVTFTSFNSGAGKKITFAGGKRTAVNFAEHLSAVSAAGVDLWDHTVAGTVNLSESGSGSASTWTATAGTVSGGACSGGVTVYHNRAKVMGQTCFSSVTYTANCCTPTAGTIVTTFSKTSASGNGIIAAAMNGKSETLAITGCGTATFTDYSGASSTVTLKSCF